MRAPVTVAVVTDGALRAYYRNGSGVAEQVAQLAVGRDIEPSAVATIVADLGDVLGWGAHAGDVPPPRRAVGRAAGALPAASTSTPKPAKRRAPQRSAPGEVEAERGQCFEVIAARPGIRRSELAEAVGIDLYRVKRRTDELLGLGLIDARPLPGVAERGPGGGHGLFAVQRAD